LGLFLTAACSAFGFVMCLRWSRQILINRWISALELTQICGGSVLLFVLIFPMKSFAISTRFFLLVHLPMVASIGLSKLVIFARRQRQFDRLDEILLTLILGMKRGLSLRSALSEASEQVALDLRPLARELYRNVAFSPQQRSNVGGQLEILARELGWIDRESQSPLQSMCRLRAKIKIERSIRRRSRQATSQARAQSVVMTCLFVGLVVASTSFFGWSQSVPFVGSAVALFTCGTIWLWVRGRKVRWSQ